MDFYFWCRYAITCNAAYRWPTLGNARNHDNSKTLVTISTSPSSTIRYLWSTRSMRHHLAQAWNLCSMQGYSQLHMVLHPLEELMFSATYNLQFLPASLTYFVWLIAHASTSFSILINLYLVPKYISWSLQPCFKGKYMCNICNMLSALWCIYRILSMWYRTWEQYLAPSWGLITGFIHKTSAGLVSNIMHATC